MNLPAPNTSALYFRSSPATGATPIHALLKSCDGTTAILGYYDASGAHQETAALPVFQGPSGPFPCFMLTDGSPA